MSPHSPGGSLLRSSGIWEGGGFHLLKYIPNSIKVALTIGYWQLGIGRWAPGIRHLGLQNNAIICLTDHKTIDTQCPITSAQSNFYWIGCIKGQSNLSFRSVKRPERAKRWILWLWKSRENVLVLWFIHVFKTLHLQHLKGMQSSKLGRRKGYPCQ